MYPYGPVQILAKNNSLYVFISSLVILFKTVPCIWYNEHQEEQGKLWSLKYHL